MQQSSAAKSTWKFPREFWMANFMELAERAAYYGFFIVLTLYLTDIVGFSDKETGVVAGIFFAGLLLGRPGEEGLIPSRFVSSLVGGNSISANFFASIVGAFMYFATLTEIPILQGLIGSGMGQGPALALLLAGPALSLPNMLVIRSVVGTKKTFVYVVLVVIMASISGMIYGNIIQ